MNRLDGELDGQLNLLDRQVVDSDGLLVCKVDDVELTEEQDGLVVTALLTGAAALIDRLGGRLGKSLLGLWVGLAPEQPGREVPWRLEMGKVARLDSAVRLTVPRSGALELRPDEDGLRQHRLGTLLGMDVQGPDGSLGRVVDVRLRSERGRLVMTQLIVGRGRPGSLLGYDRRGDMGPLLVRRVVRWLHRHTGLLPFDAVSGIHWENGHVSATAPLTPLEDADL